MPRPLHTHSRLLRLLKGSKYPSSLARLVGVLDDVEPGAVEAALADFVADGRVIAEPDRRGRTVYTAAAKVMGMTDGARLVRGMGTTFAPLPLLSTTPSPMRRTAS